MITVSRALTVGPRLRHAMAEVIVGNQDAVFAMLTALFAGGHVLMEGVPGTAKTLSARLLARLLAAETRRVQFTPDVMPSDILGTNVFDPRTTDFTLRRGPIFTNILIADEINRTSPKTQSALLEAMEERRVTIDVETERLPELFFVCATQNPIDFEGAYPLPEAQLDRFLVRANTTYPGREQELALLARVADGFDANDFASIGVDPIAGIEEILAARTAVRNIRCAPVLQGYLHDVIERTRRVEELTLGASPRAAIGLLRAVQAVAYLDERAYATPDDVKTIAAGVLAHRLILRPEAELDGVTTRDVVTRILTEIAVPRVAADDASDA